MPLLSDSKVWLKNLGGKLKILCARAFDYVDGLIKEETSEKERGSKYNTPTNVRSIVCIIVRSCTAQLSSLHWHPLFHA